jgi:pseudouridine-5'-phosphate glycosidase
MQGLKTEILDIGGDVAAALAAGQPVVALESSVIAQGLPYPDNLETALAMADTLRAQGVVPATLGILDGRLCVGMTDEEISRFSEQGGKVAKAAARDMAPLLAYGAMGALTVSASLAAAEAAGITVLATGGIGGVHRGESRTWDVSADLEELARRRVVVVCSGAKAILDLPATLERLESLGVPVVGLDCSLFPAFFCRDSGLPLTAQVSAPADMTPIARRHWSLGGGGLMLAVPPPEAAAVPRTLLERHLREAEAQARVAKIAGPALTPFLLARLDSLSGGRTRAANKALLRRNAEVAAELATALSQARGGPRSPGP